MNSLVRKSLCKVLIRTSVAALNSTSTSSAAAVHQRYSHVSRRCFVNVGDEIPVNYIKDQAAPVVMEDDKYPAWVFELAKKGPTRQELMRKLEDGSETDEDVLEAIEGMTLYEKRRLRRLITLDTIKENNVIASSEK
mmetsp:Transcript_63288/g.131667  ORF Transcript_63288/g.131667 Transcript_63288/m.131667 type:complete len:137 (+) Transcript_63288:58-468(+)